ncbi:tetratricopeptide repeat protein [Leptospira wolffii]|uniref:Tetratricopeptide repeat protein n=1 Tax=Leptospira wolffii TaxID=409998 RepID=A0ABV5BKQ1_9LEPT|nr:tetratricopeptide repeat protein [Leptospira wolffii]EPG65218.1 tetratricopeptide repeat protein [Leptospira wolffii serovar Khorat str. Khorat-H2]TGK61911.1 tetratricopeptide repeat protein [Leptospira wolffii]TGK68512.1 tetratricopeptide repeat protein [Leptospira wolffii]TGK74705.1 tetratricopeptide repeat protein [Leptospira wolffii]TGL31719.1 tetratricopeptide repeat protein [Leptospira wolffii]
MSEAEIKRKFNEALKFEKEGKASQAAKVYTDILGMNPKFQKAYLNLGALYSRIGDSEKAIKTYQKALELGKTTELYYNLGVELYRLQNLDAAVKALKSSLELNKKYLNSHLLLAYCYKQLEKPDKSELYLRNAIKIDPKNKTAYSALATIYFDTEKWEQALAAANTSLQLNPNDPRMEILATEIHVKLGNYKQSFETLKKVTSSAQGFVQFSDSIQAAKKSPKPEEKEFFNNLEVLTRKKLDEFKNKLTLSKENPQDFEAPEAQDALDLSLMYLFHGDTERALKYLLYAQKDLQENPSSEAS